MSKNRVYDLLQDLSMELHEMEENGIILTDAEDNLWRKLTEVLVEVEENENLN